MTDPEPAVRLSVLGEVCWEGRPVTGERQQRLLAALAEAGSAGASTDRLVEEVWPEETPADAGRALQVVVSRTRAATAGEVVERRGGGYRLGVPEDETDLGAQRLALERAAAAAAAGDWVEALVAARSAAAVTVGERPGDDVLARVATAAHRARRRARRLAGLAHGHLRQHGEALPLLEETLVERPDDEELVVALLRALAGTAGAATALERFERYRSGLADRLGSDPGPELRRLHAELLVSDRPVRAGIRYDATELIGRDRDLAQVRALLASGRVTSIVGAGGLGKTRLAQALAREAVQPVVHVVELVGITDPEDLVAEVGTALGVRDSVSGRRTLTPAQRRDVRSRIAQQLDQAPALLVLDNCEHLVDAVAELVAFLVASTRELRVLTTTRAPLAIAAERVHALGTLAPADAVALFRRRALAVRPDAELPEGPVRDIVTALDGLPLAVELAAAKVRMMAVEEIRRRLENRFALLRGGDRSAPDRHQTLLAVIDWSWNLLADAERRALSWLSVFHDGFTLTAAENVLGPDAFASVQHLVDQSLLAVSEAAGRARYRMLETVREFGRMQLVDAGEDRAAARAHRGWALSYAAGHADMLLSASQFESVDAVEAEEANLADALRQALVAGDPEAVVRLLATLAPYWAIRGDHSRIFVVVEAVAAALRDWTPPENLADATRIALAVTLTQSMIVVTEATAPLQEVLRRTGPGELPWVSAVVRAVSAFDQVDPGAFLERLRHYAGSPEPDLAMAANQWLSHVLENAGDLDGAIAAAERGLALTPPTAGPWIAAILHTQCAQLSMQLGRSDDAIEHAAAALPVLERVGAVDDVLGMRSLLALAAIVRGELEAARREFELIAALPGDTLLGGRVVQHIGEAELQLACGEVGPALAAYRDMVESVRLVRLPGLPSTGTEPWVVFGEAAALVAHAHRAGPELDGYGDGLAATLHDRLARCLAGEDAYLDRPVCGLGLLALGTWTLLRERIPAADAVRLLALAGAFAYNRTVPSTAWDRIAPLAEQRAPGVLQAHSEGLSAETVARAALSALDPLTCAAGSSAR